MTAIARVNLGDIIEERFTILRKLGAGGMAVVYLAQDAKQDKKVALKFLSPRAFTDAATLKRFQREYTICARFDHPNIVKLFHFGTSPDGARYCAMEFISGLSLDEVLQAEERLEPERVLTIMQGVCSALAAFHKEGIVHRDLKPANIMIAPQEGGGERVIVMDFGLARDVNATALTKTGAILGTPYYLSPELALGERADFRTDIWQVGAITQELVTGRKTFSGDSLNEVVSAILSGTPEPIVEQIPGISPLWDEVIAKCVEKAPIDRYASAELLLQDLKDLEASRPLSSKKVTAKTRKSRRARKSVPLKKTGAVSAVNKTGPTKVISSVHKLALAVGFLLFMLAFWVLKPSGPIHYDVKRLAVQAGVDRLSITWASETAYPSRIQLLEPMDRVFASLREERTNKHEVVITGLPSNTECHFRVLYPSGETSLKKTALTGKALLKVTKSETLPSGISFRWLIEPPALCELRGNKNEIIQVEKLDRSFQAKVPKDLVAATVIATFADGGKSELSLSSSLNAQIKKSRLAMETKTLTKMDKGFTADESLSPSSVTGRIGLKENSKEMKEFIKNKEAKEAAKGERVCAAIKKYIGNSKALPAYKELSGLAPLSLGTPLLSLDERLQLFHSLQDFFSFNVFAKFNDGELNDTIARPDFGDFAMALNKQSGQAKEVTIFKSHNRPIVLGKPLGFLRKCETKWQRKFLLQELEEFKRAEFKIVMDCVSHSAYRLHINGRANILVFDERSHKYGDIKLTVFQRLPGDLLRIGENDLAITFEPLFIKFTDRQHVIHELTLRLLK